MRINHSRKYTLHEEELKYSKKKPQKTFGRTAPSANEIKQMEIRKMKM